MSKMTKAFKRVLMGLLFVMVAACAPVWAAEDKTPRMLPEELKAMLGSPDLVIIDVRSGGAWRVSRQKIKGAVREDPEDPRPWADKYSKDKVLVFYCA